MRQRVRSMWAYVQDHYLEEFDYFQGSGGDIHTIVENLRSFL